MRKPQKWFVMTVLGLAGLAYGLVFAEYFLRWFTPQALIPRYVTATPWGIRGNAANVVYRHRTPEADIEIRTNNQGMRDDRTFTQAKSNGTCRIALLGDSYFMGYEAALEDTIAFVLEQQLQQAGYRAEVLNFAVSGFGTAEMQVMLENYGQSFSPDIVVFQWHGSDLADNVRSNLFRLGADGRAEPTGLTYLPGVAIRDHLSQYAAYRWLIGTSHLYNAVREKTAVAVKRILAQINQAAAAPTREQQEQAPGAKETEAERRLAAAILDYAQAYSTQKGHDWLLFEIPTWSSRTAFISSLARDTLSPRVAQSVVSPLKALQQAADPKTKIYLEQGHRHFSPLGNKIAATVLADEIIARNAVTRLRDCRS